MKCGNILNGRKEPKNGLKTFVKEIFSKIVNAPYWYSFGQCDHKAQMTKFQTAIVKYFDMFLIV